MRHLNKIKKFHRPRDQRRALFKTLSHNLILNGRLTTTTERAKAVKRQLEPLVTRAKQQDLNSLRHLLARLPKASSYKLFHELAPKYKERPGGYLRLVKLPVVRKGDGAQLSLIEFV